MSTSEIEDVDEFLLSLLEAPAEVIEPVAEPVRGIESHYGIVNDPGVAEVERVLGWQVDSLPLFLESGQQVKTHVANCRVDGDKHRVLGIVGAGYGIIQNRELIELANVIRNEHELQFANAGITKDGARVFFQCKGESFDVGDGDEVVPYMLFCNGHDGTLSCRMMPMTERMFCQNQLGNIVKNTQSWAVIRHSGDVKSKLAEAGRLGRQYLVTCKANREAMLDLRATGVKHEDLMKFFGTTYQKHYGKVDQNPKDEAGERAVQRMKDGFGEFMKRFDKEKPVAGATAWNMANAYTGWIQHDKNAGKNTQKSQRSRYESSLFGVLADRSVEAFRAALSL